MGRENRGFMLYALCFLLYIGIALAWFLDQAPSFLSSIAAGITLLFHLHFFLSQKRHRQWMDEMATLRTQIAATLRHQRRLDDDLQRIRSALSLQASEEPDSIVSGVVAEVKVLQNLIEQLYQTRQAPHQPPLLLEEESGAMSDEAILNVLHRNVREEGVEIVLQPIVTLPQRKRVYYECFSRLRMPDGGMMHPEQYLPIAERHDLIATIDNMLLVRCIQLLRKVQRQEKSVGFFLNLSQHTLKDARFLKEFVSLMAENAALAPSIIFELPQRALAAFDAGLLRHLEQLASLGYRFSLDQVQDLRIDCQGLSELGFRFMKIEAGQLLRLARMENNDPRDIKRMLDLHAIDLIAERIEVERDLIELLDFDIDFGQGYLFGPPRLPRLDQGLAAA